MLKWGRHQYHLSQLLAEVRNRFVSPQTLFWTLDICVGQSVARRYHLTVSHHWGPPQEEENHCQLVCVRRLLILHIFG